MRYFKNAELARLYNVSEKSVRNWVDSARNGKIELELYSDGDKAYIADTLGNERLLEKFTVRAKKYRNSSSLKKLTPTDEFYENHGPLEVRRTIDELENYSEFLQQYRNLGRGAIGWSTYLHKLNASDATKGNILTNTRKLVAANKEYILALVSKYKHVNIVDIGVGNGLAAKDLIQILLDAGKLRRYIGVDVSPQLLSITQHNINTWFQGRVTFEAHQKDILYDRFDEIRIIDTYGDDESATINIYLLFGGTIKNFRRPEQALSAIYDSMGPNDIFLTSTKLDTPTARKFFDFNTPAVSQKLMSNYDEYSVELLGISPDTYDIEQVYDSELRSRLLTIKLKTAVAIYFEVGRFQKTINFEKGHKLVVWRIWHFTAEELINLYHRCGFRLIQVMSTPDEEVALYISKTRKLETKRYPTTN